MDYLMCTENITHMGDGRGGIGRLTGSDKTAMRLLSDFYRRLFAEFEFTPAHRDHFVLAFDTLKAAKLRKEIKAADAAKAKAVAKAQVLCSSPSLVRRLASIHESPLKQVPPPSLAAAGAEGSRTPTPAQVRACSPKLLPGERLSPRLLVCRMYTRDAPAEVDRPLPRLRSQAGSASRSGGGSTDSGARNDRTSASASGSTGQVHVVSPPSASASRPSAMPAAPRATPKVRPKVVQANVPQHPIAASEAAAAQPRAESVRADESDGGQQPGVSTRKPPSVHRSADSPASPAHQQPLRASPVAPATTDPAPSGPPTQAPSSARAPQPQPRGAQPQLSHAALASSAGAPQSRAAAQQSWSAPPGHTHPPPAADAQREAPGYPVVGNTEPPLGPGRGAP